MTAQPRHHTLGMVIRFLRVYPMRSTIMVVCMALSGMLEGLSLALFLPMLELVGHTEGREPSSFFLAVRRAFEEANLPFGVGSLTVVIIIGISLKGGLVWAAMQQAGRTVARVAADLRLTLLRSLLEARWSFFSSQPVGAFANAVSSEARNASDVFRHAMTALSSSFQFLVYLALAFSISWPTALFALGSGLLVFVALHRLIRLSRRAGRDQAVLIKSLAARLVDALQGIKSIKAMGQESRLIETLQGDTEALNAAQCRKVTATETLSAFQEPLTAIIVGAGLYVVVTFIRVPFFHLLVLGVLFMRLSTQMNLIVRQYQLMSIFQNDYWLLQGLVHASTGQREVRRAGAPPPDTLHQGIRLDGVTFAYAERPVLDRVSLDIPAGGFTALIGPSGAGKTTLADLVAGLQSPSAGEIRVDGRPLAEFDITAWRNRIGYVPQELFLFHDTILSNVTMGDPRISPQDAEEALGLAGAREFIQALPQGAATVVGERGSRLSGGQRQRISLARALARRPLILILDEVTASLDPETAAGICATLAGLKGKVTMLAVSHQASIQQIADRVYWVAQGDVRPAGDAERSLERMLEDA